VDANSLRFMTYNSDLLLVRDMSCDLWLIVESLLDKHV